MFVRRVPIFQRGDILRKEMLSELSETFYLSEDLKYTGYSDGILYGCNLSTTETAILINPGAIYKGQKVFLLKDPVVIPYYPTNTSYSLVIKILGENHSEQFLSNEAEVSLLPTEQKQSSQLEFCRFKLQPGARLRYDYVDFEDRNTEFDTLNTIWAPYAAPKHPTLQLEIIQAFALEMLALTTLSPTDISFCLQILAADRPIPFDAIAAYLQITTNAKTNYKTNFELYSALNMILQSRKSGHLPQTKSNPSKKGTVYLL